MYNERVTGTPRFWSTSGPIISRFASEENGVEGLLTPDLERENFQYKIYQFLEPENALNFRRRVDEFLGEPS